MGLALMVGILPDLKENDPDGFEEYQKLFQTLGDYTEGVGIAPHPEPEGGSTYDWEMYGYSGLHYLRRIAAHLDAGLPLPEPGDDQSSNDDVLEGYFDDVTGRSPGVFKQLFQRKRHYERGFDHLIVHSDAEGFYLPTDFEHVLFPDDEFAIPGAMVGSSHRLLRECERLAKALGIPPGLDSQADALWDAADSQGEGDEHWSRYGIESFTCVALLEACKKSIETNASIVFV